MGKIEVGKNVLARVGQKYHPFEAVVANGCCRSPLVSRYADTIKPEASEVVVACNSVEKVAGLQVDTFEVKFFDVEDARVVVRQLQSSNEQDPEVRCPCFE